MTFLKVLLILVEVFVCLLLIGVILMQKSKQQGAGLAFGAGMGESLFGGQAGNVLTKITVVLTIVFLVNTTILTYLSTRRIYALPPVPPPAAQPAAMPQGPDMPAMDMAQPGLMPMEGMPMEMPVEPAEPAAPVPASTPE